MTAGHSNNLLYARSDLDTMARRGQLWPRPAPAAEGGVLVHSALTCLSLALPQASTFQFPKAGTAELRVLAKQVKHPLHVSGGGTTGSLADLN